jgi:hypothetical protein
MDLDRLRRSKKKEKKVKQNEFEASPISNEIMEIIKELCDMSGYGITSGIHTGEKGHAAARYIRDKLHEAGLSDAKLEPIKVNNPYPNHYELKATFESQETDLSESCFPIQWTAGTSKEGLSGELAYVGDGSVSQFERIDVSGKIALIDEKFIRGYIASAKDAATIAARSSKSAKERRRQYFRFRHFVLVKAVGIILEI